MIAAFLDGAHRVARAPLLVAGIYLATALTVVPLGLAVADAVEPHLGNSSADANVASRVDRTWWEEFQAHATSFARTLQPRIAGFAVVVMNLSGRLDAPLDGTVVMTAVAYLVAWAFLIGGLLDRLARQQRVGSVGFLAACGVYFFRFCRLAVLATVVYAALFTVAHTWLFGDLYALATRDVTSTSTAVALQVGLYTLFGLVLLAVNLVVDYAKIRAVVEDRRSMVGAVLASIRFVRRRPADVVGLYLLNGLVYVLLLGAYAGVAAGVTIDWSLWQGVLIAQAYVVVRLLATLVLFASQTAYFQSQLAHPTYVAAPQPRWPKTPGSEAVPPQPAGQVAGACPIA